MRSPIILYGLVPLMVSLLGWVWLICGISGWRDILRHEERERARATGTVMEVIRVERRYRGRRGSRPKTFVSYYPVVEFQAEGRLVRDQSAYGFPTKELSVGDSVEILYDADDPSHFHLDGTYDRLRRVNTGYILAGILWLIISVPMIRHIIHV